MALQNEVPLSFSEYSNFVKQANFTPNSGASSTWHRTSTTSPSYYKDGEYTRAELLYDEARKDDRVSFKHLVRISLARSGSPVGEHHRFLCRLWRNVGSFSALSDDANVARDCWIYERTETGIFCSPSR
jgi:hypothetical protein